MALNGRNIVFPIKRADGEPFHNLVLRKATFESVVMSLDDKITGDVYYPDNTLACTMQEYIEFEGVHYILVSPPTIVREGMVSDNSELNGMTKYSFTFYHPMYQLFNLPFTDVAVSLDEQRYKSQDLTFSWIGYLPDLIAKLNKNLQSTQWVVVMNDGIPEDKLTKLSEVLSFSDQMIADVLKTAYETYDVTYVTSQVMAGMYFDIHGNDYYDLGKRFAVIFGDPTNDIYESPQAEESETPFIFRFGKGVGLKNNSADPRNNKIVTRLAGYGSEDNVPFGYPQIRWTGNQDWDYTINNDPNDPNGYPIYKGILGGEWVKLIKHPFTRQHLMPSIYTQTVSKKVNPLAQGYNPNTEIVDYYDADNSYPNPLIEACPSFEIHQFEDIKPELDVDRVLGIVGVELVSNDEVNQMMNIVGDYESQIITYQQFHKFVTQIQEGLLVDIIDRDEILEALDDVQDYALTDTPYKATTSHGFIVSLEPHYGYLLVTIDIPTLVVTYYVQPATAKYRKVDNGTTTPQPTDPTPTNTPTSASGLAWDDTMDDDGNYKQSYFKITIPQLPFDLYACAAIPQEMEISMRSGACIGCTFKVMIDWDDYKKSFYDTDGNFTPQGDNRNLEKYPNSANGAITLTVQKDNETFGTIMPNIYQEPKEGDVFVILGISLPLTYVTDAEQRLENKMLEYLRANNVHYFDYPLKFDEYFLAMNTYILNQIKPNCRVQFDFAGEIIALFVKEMTIKFGEATLPTYDITLTDKIEVSLNQIGQVVEDVNSLSNMLERGIAGGGFGNFSTNEINKKLSRVNNDTAEGQITFQQGIKFNQAGGVDANANAVLRSASSQDFMSDVAFGTGWRVWLEDNLSKLEVDSLTVRKVMNVAELLIHKVRATGGEIIVSNADGKIKSVQSTNDGWTCILESADGGDTTFVVGDYALCQTWENNTIRRYCAKVVSVNGSTVLLESGNYTPVIGDNLVQFGSTVESRQGLVRIAATEGGEPIIDVYDNVDNPNITLANLKARLGGLDGITDRVFGENQPHGYGLYSNNAYLRGELVLANGTSVGSKFEMLENRFLSRITDSSLADNLVKNPYFDDVDDRGIVDWDTNFDAELTTPWIRRGNFPIVIDGLLVATEQPTSNSCITYRDGIKVLHLANGDYISQTVPDNGLTNYLRIRVYSKGGGTLVTSSYTHQLMGGWETLSEAVEPFGMDYDVYLRPSGGWVEIESVILAPTVTSEILQTADEIKLSVTDDLGETGIDITNHTITLSADKTIVDGDLEVNRLNTIPQNGLSRIEARGSLMQVFGANGIVNIQFGVDENGYAVLKYYDNTGNLLYNLGPEGLTYSTAREERRIAHIVTASPTETGAQTTLYEYQAKMNAGVVVAGDIVPTQAAAAEKNMRWFTDSALTTVVNGGVQGLAYFEVGGEVAVLTSLAKWGGDFNAAREDMGIPATQTSGASWDTTNKSGSVDPYELNTPIKWRQVIRFDGGAVSQDDAGKPRYETYYWQ